MWDDKEFFEFQGGNNYTAAKVVKIIFLRTTDTFDQTMDAQTFKTARYLTNSKTGKVAFQVFGAQSIDGIFCAYDKFKEVLYENRILLNDIDILHNHLFDVFPVATQDCHPRSVLSGI
ncbi:MAG: hypothetical protein ACYC6Q_02815 [Syntrophales bacterium]